MVERLKVFAWCDPEVDHAGHDPRSTYVERFWLPVLGPTCLWLLRNLSAALEVSPGGLDLDIEHTARQIGLGGRRGRYRPFQRAVGRLVTFELARFLQQLPPSWPCVGSCLPSQGATCFGSILRPGSTIGSG